jgi:hypothetical protein
MRRSGDETQLTRTVATLAQFDETLASQLATAVLSTAAKSGNARAAELMGCVPNAVTLTSEDPLGPVQLGRRKARGGRLDWKLAAEGFLLLVEVKIGAVATGGQLRRYLGEFERFGGSGGLLLLARVTEEVPPAVHNNARWLGQIRWDQLIPRLTTMSFGDDEVAGQWQSLLSVVQRPGDLGDEPIDWEVGNRTVGERNRLVLLGLRDRATEATARQLAERTRRPSTDGLCGARAGKRRRSVATTGTAARLTLYVPAAKGPPVIEVELDGEAPLALATAVDPGSAPLFRRRTDHAKSLQSLRRAGFSEDSDGWYVARDEVSPATDTESPVEATWRTLEVRLQRIVATGILDAQVR